MKVRPRYQEALALLLALGILLGVGYCAAGRHPEDHSWLPLAQRGVSRMESTRSRLMATFARPSR